MPGPLLRLLAFQVYFIKEMEIDYLHRFMNQHGSKNNRHRKERSMTTGEAIHFVYIPVILNHDLLQIITDEFVIKIIYISNGNAPEVCICQTHWRGKRCKSVWSVICN